MYRTLQDIIRAINEFDAECVVLEYTDAEGAWDLFRWIKKQAETMLKEALDDHS